MNHLERMYARMEKREKEKEKKNKVSYKLQAKIWRSIAKKCEIIAKISDKI